MNFFKSKTYLNFILYFILYGAIIAVITSFVSYKLQFSDIEEKIALDAKFTASNQMNQIADYIQDIERNLYSLTQNPIFVSYLQKYDNPSKQLSEKLFLHASMTNPNFFQIRFIDSTGKEKIRIDKDRSSNNPLMIREKNLQDKSERYYFKESIGHREGTYWRSNIDLNVEHGKLEKPLRPTLRVATPAYFEGTLRGIVIINVDLTELFHAIQKSNEFDLYIIDKDGYFLLHPNPKYSWSRYIKSEHKLENDFPENASNIVDKSNYESMFLNSFSIEHIVQNNEKLMLVLHTNDKYINELNENNYTLTVYLAILILIISVPLGIILSITPAKLQNELNKLLKMNSEQLEIIDKSVITSTTDLNGKITNVSSAMAEVSGYSKEELIGEKHSILKSGKMSQKVYHTLWKTITSGMVWKGEVQNKTKDDEYFWLNLTILPHYNSEHALDGYIAICSDATAKKAMEYISEHDKLTSLANRGRLDFVLEKEFFKSLRYKHPLSIILIDIDHFKKVNDTHGHLVGDSVLIEIANLLTAITRKSDTTGRWGGEEFLIICTDTELSGALTLAENLRMSIEKHDFKTIGNTTVSIGVSQLEKNDSLESMLKRCDDNLYKAKDSGRNCIKY